MTTPHQPPSRAATAALLAPALLTAIWLLSADINGGWARADPAADMPFVDTLVDDRFALAFQHIRAGIDPNAPIAYRDDTLTNGQELKLTPLLIAIARDRSDTVLMLLSRGIKIDMPGNRYAMCLAKQRGQTRTLEMIPYLTGDNPPTDCPPPAPDGAPALAAYVD